MRAPACGSAAAQPPGSRHTCTAGRPKAATPTAPACHCRSSGCTRPSLSGLAAPRTFTTNASTTTCALQPAQRHGGGRGVCTERRAAQEQAGVQCSQAAVPCSRAACTAPPPQARPPRTGLNAAVPPLQLAAPQGLVVQAALAGPQGEEGLLACGVAQEAGWVGWVGPRCRGLQGCAVQDACKAPQAQAGPAPCPAPAHQRRGRRGRRAPGTRPACSRPAAAASSARSPCPRCPAAPAPSSWRRRRPAPAC